MRPTHSFEFDLFGSAGGGRSDTKAVANHVNATCFDVGQLISAIDC